MRVWHHVLGLDVSTLMLQKLHPNLSHKFRMLLERKIYECMSHLKS